MDVEKRENRAVTESLTRIKGEAFCERTVLCIPRHFTRIGEEAFRENQRIERLEVPKIVTCIGERAFYGCSALNREPWKSWERAALQNVQRFRRSISLPASEDCRKRCSKAMWN